MPPPFKRKLGVVPIFTTEDREDWEAYCASIIGILGNSTNGQPILTKRLAFTESEVKCGMSATALTGLISGG
jgi:hypothetical protein